MALCGVVWWGGAGAKGPQKKFQKVFHRILNFENPGPIYFFLFFWSTQNDQSRGGLGPKAQKRKMRMIKRKLIMLFAKYKSAKPWP